MQPNPTTSTGLMSPPSTPPSPQLLTHSTTTSISTSTSSINNDSPITNTKRISGPESLIIATAYKYHDGNWRAIMADEKIKKLQRTETHLRNHIDYLRKKKNKVTTGERGTKRKRDIILSIEESVDESQDLTENVNNVIENGPPNLEQEDQEAEFNIPESPRDRILFDVDADSLSETVAPSQISTAESYREFVSASKDRQEQRHEAIRNKIRVRNEQLKDIREQRQERQESNDIKNLLMMMIVQQQQQQQQTNNLLNMALLKYLKDDNNGSSQQGEE